MTYRIDVRFERDLGDDLAVINATGNEPDLGGLLAQQIAKELQAGCDELGTAGSFQVAAVYDAAGNPIWSASFKDNLSVAVED